MTATSIEGDNSWGYATLDYFAPDRRYAADKTVGGPTREFKAMVSSTPSPTGATRSPKTGAAAQEIVFPDRVAYEFDAAPLADDVLVFATGKPSVLLLGSRRAQPIQLSAKERSWLGRLSSPSLYVDGTSVHIAGC